MRNLKQVIVSLICSAVIASTQAVRLKKAQQEKPTATTLDVVRSAPELNSFYKDLQATGVDKTLVTKSKFTVFAPDNAAYNKLQANTVNPNELAAVIKHHIVPGKKSLNQIEKEQKLTTVHGSTLRTKYKDHYVLIKTNQKDVFGKTDKVHQYARVIKTLPAANGTVCVIDEVLLPSKKTKKQK